MAGEASRAAGQTFPSERAGVVLPHHRRAARRRRRDLSLEFSGRHAGAQDRAGAGLGQHRRLQAVVADAVVRRVLMELLEKAGVPPGVVNLVTGPGPVVGEALDSGRPRRRASRSRDRPTSAGTSTRRRRAGCRRVQLELGGKNPAVVIDYDDLDGAAREIVAAAFLCSGQRCTAISRVIVVEAQADALVERILVPRRPNQGRRRSGAGTTMGPLVSHGSAAHRRRLRASGRRFGLPAAHRGQEPLTEAPERDGYLLCADGVRPGPADSPLARRGDLRPGAADPARAGLGRGDCTSPTARATVWRRRCSRHGLATCTSSPAACRPA